MPLYEYRCRDCGVHIEILQPIGAGADGLTCTGCGSEGLDKMLSTFSGQVSGGTSRSASSSCVAPQPGGGCGAPAGFS